VGVNPKSAITLHISALRAKQWEIIVNLLPDRFCVTLSYAATEFTYFPIAMTRQYVGSKFE
jgi:hypothetical protein